jgi:plastocyanin
MRALLLGVALGTLLAGCGGGDTTTNTGRTPTPLDHATTGTIEGVVHVEGPVSPPARLPVTPECAAQRETPLLSGDLVAHDGNLENVFVYLKEGLGDRVFAVPGDSVKIDQRGCVYNPRVVGAMVGQPITFINSDPLLHNVHGSPRDSSAWNFGMGVRGSERTLRIPKPEVMVSVRCDVHPWMQGYIGVLDHPYFAVTGADGAFSLRDVPPGDYVVAAWHERLGTREARASLAPSGHQQVPFTFTAK